MKYLLALDQGSHASRAVVFDASGSELAHAHVPVTTRREGHDRVEHDPEEIVRSLRLAAEDALEAHGMHGRQAVAAAERIVSSHHEASATDAQIRCIRGLTSHPGVEAQIRRGLTRSQASRLIDDIRQGEDG